MLKSAEQNSVYNLKSLLVISSTALFNFSAQKKDPNGCRSFSEIISSQCDVNVIERFTNHFTCMKLGHVKIVSELATFWWNKQTFEIPKYLIIYAYDLCTRLGSSEWVKSLSKDINLCFHNVI